MVKPECAIFGTCGGCAYQDIDYQEELQIKEDQLRLLLKDFLSDDQAFFENIVASPKPYHYRHRLDLKMVKTKDQRLLIGFTPKTGRGIVEVDSCPIAREEVDVFIPQLKEEVVQRLKVFPKYRRANLVVRTGEDGRVVWGGIGRRSNRLAEKDYLSTTVIGRKIFYSLDTFFQANLSILDALFNRIRSLPLWNVPTVLYDLYGGVGLFSVALADKAEKIILIEDCPSSVALARINQQHHSWTQWQIVAGRVEDHLSGLLAHEARQQVAVIDPPRAGLTEQALDFFARATQLDCILYLSCNPEALARDLVVFHREGWMISHIMPFDFFPKTVHLETLVVLKKVNNHGKK